MIYSTNQAIQFVGKFTADKALKIGLTDVAVVVYTPDGTLVAPALVPYELAGLWIANMPAGFNTTAGLYKAIFTTSDAAVDAAFYVDIAQVQGVPFATETSLAADLTFDLAGILAGLRIRLNDLDGGNYTTAELQYCANIGLRETVVSSRCHKIRLSVPVVAGVHTYDCDNIFAPISVFIGAKQLNRSSVKQIGDRQQNWDVSDGAAPTDWMAYSGGAIRLFPTPVAPVTAIVYGYAKPAALINASDAPSELPEGSGMSAILDRAEAEARKMRITTAYNAAAYDKLMDSWKTWVGRISASVRGED